MAEPVAIKPISGYDEKLYTPDFDKKRLMPTFAEWGGIRGTQIIRSAFKVGSGSGTLFTVPIGNEFYMTTAFCGAASGGVAVGNAIIYFVRAGTNIFIADSLTFSTSGENTTSQTFSMPLKFNENETILWNNTNSGYSSFGITGFLVQKGVLTTGI